MSIQLTIDGEPGILLPEKLLLLPERRTLLVADTHFGKAATFRQSGIPVPGGTTQAMLERLSRTLQRHSASRLIILGDFVHSTVRAQADFESELIEWRQRHTELEICLVAGNHDRGHRQLFDELRLDVVNEPYVEGAFAFCHFHQANDNASLFTFAGHVHPAVRLPAISQTGGRIPCFAFSHKTALLPAFGEFTGTALVSRNEFPDLYLVAEDTVIALNDS